MSARNRYRPWFWDPPASFLKKAVTEIVRDWMEEYATLRDPSYSQREILENLGKYGPQRIEVEPRDLTPVCSICQKPIYILAEHFLRFDPPELPSKEIVQLFGHAIDFRSFDRPIYCHRTCPRSVP